jgi:GPH family glycoside/pentoside/hexuronide:cation symporter
VEVEMPPSGETTAPGRAYDISRGDIVAYGLAAFGPGLLLSPMTMYVPQLYAKEFGISLAALGAALVALRFVNAFTDQIIGFLSDRTRTRWGARKPWIVAGAALTLVAAFFLLRPPPIVGLTYLILWKIVYDLAYTITDINYTAWGAELSSDYNMRSRITGTRGFVNQIGNLANDALPIIVFMLGLTASSAYSIETLSYFFVVAVVVIPLTTGYSLWRAPRGIPLPAERANLLGFIRSVRHNKPLWLYVASFMLGGIGLGVLQIIFTFYDGYLKVGAWYPYMMTVFALTMTGSVPIWAWTAQRLGKHRTYVLSVFISSMAMQGFWFVDPLTMSQGMVVAIGMVIVIFIGIGASATIVVSPAILADVVDYGRLKTGDQRTGGYFAFYMLTSKIAMAIGAGGAFMLLAAFGYDAKAGAVNTGWAAFGIMFTVAIMPAIFKLTGAAIMWNFPIDRRRHAIIQRRLQQRAERAERDAGLAL